MPEVEIESRQPRLIDRRHVRHRQRTLVRRHRKGLEQPVADVPPGGRRGVHHHVDVAGQHVLRGGTGAAIRDELKLRADGVLKEYAGDMARAADAGVADRDLAGIGFDARRSAPGDCSAGSVFLPTIMKGWVEIRPTGSQVLQQIDRQVVHRAAGDIGAPLADLHDVAVGRRARDADHPGRAAGAGRVFDDHRLAEMRPHRLRP